MRDGKAIDLDIADAKGCPGLETIQARRVFAPRDGGSSETSDEDGHVERTRERYQSADVIGMLVRDQDRVQFFSVLIDRGEARENVPLAEAGVY
jgi:hypothetical protein